MVTVLDDENNYEIVEKHNDKTSKLKSGLRGITHDCLNYSSTPNKTAINKNIKTLNPSIYLAGNYCYRINAIALPGGADTLLTQIIRHNPSKPDKTQQNGQKRRGCVVLSGVMSRSKELKIPRSLRACRFKSGPGDHLSYCYKYGLSDQNFRVGNLLLWRS